jgi:hypothetical protein
VNWGVHVHAREAVAVNGVEALLEILADLGFQGESAAEVVSRTTTHPYEVNSRIYPRQPEAIHENTRFPSIIGGFLGRLLGANNCSEADDQDYQNDDTFHSVCFSPL